MDLLAGLKEILPEDRLHTDGEELDRRGRAFFTYHVPHALYIVDYALAGGGTLTGEHGASSGKTKHLDKEHGDSLPFIREVKKLADSNGVLNPGKVFSN